MELLRLPVPFDSDADYCPNEATPVKQPFVAYLTVIQSSASRWPSKAHPSEVKNGLVDYVWWFFFTHRHQGGPDIACRF